MGKELAQVERGDVPGIRTLDSQIRIGAHFHSDKELFFIFNYLKIQF